MGATDPRILISALSDLQAEGERWLIKARETIEDAGQVQRDENENATQVGRESRIVKTRADDDREQVDEAIVRTKQLVEQCLEAVNRAGRLLTNCETALNKANTTLYFWQQELEKALAWLVRTQKRLRKAIVELNTAKSELASARRGLSRAERRLRKCQNDKERRNCNSEVKRYNKAVDNVNSAIAHVNVAQAEVRAAEAEFQRAKARVDCCEQAVSITVEAVQLAKHAQELATQSIVEAEHSLDHARAARRFVEQAEEEVERELEEAQEMLTQARQQEVATKQAGEQFYLADNLSISAQTLLTRNRHELNFRIEQLRALNRVGSTNMGNSSINNTISSMPRTQMLAQRPKQADKADVDRNANPIILREYAAPNSWSIYVFDISLQSVDRQSIGSNIGRASLGIEKDSLGNRKAKLNHIEIDSSHRDLGISNQMLDYIEQGARQRGISEIYGSIEGKEALSYWQRQKKHGWQIQERQDHFYGIVCKLL